MDTLALRRLFHDEELVHSLRNLIDEEKKAYTMAAVAQAKSNYQLRNITVNEEQGKPSEIFAKVPKASGNKDTITSEEKKAATEKVKQMKPPKLTKLIERKQISKPLSNCGSFMSLALSQVKVSLPLLEVMKFLDYKNKTIKILSNVGEVNKEDHRPRV